jgi:hypothetical protein
MSGDVFPIPEEAIEAADHPHWTTEERLRAAAPLILAAELDRLADNIRAEAGDPHNGWRANETYRAQKIFGELKRRASVLRGEGQTSE